MPDRALLSIRNNIAWCDTICRAHGLPGELSPDLWMQPRRGPPYYSNAITRSRALDEALLTAIERLQAALPDGFSIKDANAALDLSGLGFRILFDAEWIWHAGGETERGEGHGRVLHTSPLPDTLPQGERERTAEWFKVESEAELVEWEAAWAAAGSPSATRVFLPTLLKEKSLAFFGARQEERIVAGAAANRSEGKVVGFSNFFAPAQAREVFRAAAVARVAAFAPGSPIVGYERGDDLTGMMALGFRSVGKLRVWLWP
jgi:hypothetical protein